MRRKIVRLNTFSHRLTMGISRKAMAKPTKKGMTVCSTARMACQMELRCSSVTASSIPVHTTIILESVFPRKFSGIGDFMRASVFASGGVGGPVIIRIVFLNIIAHKPPSLNTRRLLSKFDPFFFLLISAS